MAKKAIPTDEEILLKALPNDAEIQQEYNRLLELFRDSNPAAVALHRKTIARAAFLSIVLDRLEKDVAENGYREEYANGANQRGYKQSVAASMIPSYSKLFLTCMKQLQDALHPAKQEAPDELLEFLAKQEKDGKEIPAWAANQLDDFDRF